MYTHGAPTSHDELVSHSTGGTIPHGDTTWVSQHNCWGCCKNPKEGDIPTEYVAHLALTSQLIRRNNLAEFTFIFCPGTNDVYRKDKPDEITKKSQVSS